MQTVTQYIEKFVCLSKLVKWEIKITTKFLNFMYLLLMSRCLLNILKLRCNLNNGVKYQRLRTCDFHLPAKKECIFASNECHFLVKNVFKIWWAILSHTFYTKESFKFKNKNQKKENTFSSTCFSSSLNNRYCKLYLRVPKCFTKLIISFNLSINCNWNIIDVKYAWNYF